MDVVVQLKKLRSYSGYGIRATQENPLVTVDPETAAALVASGHFIYPNGAPPEPEEDQSHPPDIPDDNPGEGGESEVEDSQNTDPNQPNDVEDPTDNPDPMEGITEENMKVADLQARAKEMGIRGYSSMNKTQLIEAIRNEQPQT